MVRETESADQRAACRSRRAERTELRSALRPCPETKNCGLRLFGPGSSTRETSTRIEIASLRTAKRGGFTGLGQKVRARDEGPSHIRPSHILASPTYEASPHGHGAGKDMFFLSCRSRRRAPAPWTCSDSSSPRGQSARRAMCGAWTASCAHDLQGASMRKADRNDRC